MDPSKKSLPPLPADPKKRAGGRPAQSTPVSTPPLSPPSSRKEPQTSQSEKQLLQHLHQENARLRKQLAKLRDDRDEKDKRIAILERQNRQYCENDKKNKKLVVRIANALSDAFHDYQASLQQPTKEQPRYTEINADKNRVGYEEVISAWSDYSSS